MNKYDKEEEEMILGYPKSEYKLALNIVIWTAVIFIFYIWFWGGIKTSASDRLSKNSQLKNIEHAELKLKVNMRSFLNKHDSIKPVTIYYGEDRSLIRSRYKNKDFDLRHLDYLGNTDKYEILNIKKFDKPYSTEHNGPYTWYAQVQVPMMDVVIYKSIRESNGLDLYMLDATGQVGSEISRKHIKNHIIHFYWDVEAKMWQDFDIKMH